MKFFPKSLENTLCHLATYAGLHKATTTTTTARKSGLHVSYITTLSLACQNQYFTALHNYF